MTSIKNLKFPISLFLDKMGIEIMFDDHLVKKQPHLDKKYWFYIVVILKLF